MQDFLKLPLKFEQLFNGHKLNTCNVKDSIARNLHLLITTFLGENKQDVQYGSQFWDNDYDIHLSNDRRREVVMNSLKTQIRDYEKRLLNVTIDVNVKQAEFKTNTGSQLRRKIEIIINGSVARSKEPFRFQTGFFIGPLSFD